MIIITLYAIVNRIYTTAIAYYNIFCNKFLGIINLLDMTTN